MKYVFTAGIAVLIAMAGCGGPEGPAVPAEAQRALANELYNRELYTQALAEYGTYLDNYALPDEIRANVIFTIGNIYFERIRDYESALAEYIKVKNLYPESAVMAEVNKQIIACLERLDRSADARQALSEATSLDESQIPGEKRPGEVIAKIGDREITRGDLDFEIEETLKRLPPDMRPKEISKDEKLQMLRQHLTIELLYNTAARMGLDKEKDVIRETFEAKKMIMASRLQQKEIEEKVRVSDSDIKLYYNDHKDEFAEKDEKGNIKRQKSLQDAWNEVAERVQQVKAQEVVDDLIERAMKAENVQIFQDRIQ